jgi:hypothetical protein
MNARMIASCAATFVLGFALARVWPTASSPKLTPATHVPIDKGTTVPVVLSNEQSKSSHTAHVRGADSKSDPNGAKDRRFLATLRDRDVKFHFLTRRDEIDEEFASMLGLGLGQIASLNSALKKARDRLNDLSAQAASVSTPEEGVLVVRVTPFEGGASVYDDLMNAVQSELGEERGAEFKKVFGDEFADAFQNFGALQRTLKIARSFPGYEDWKDGGLWMKDERRTASGTVETLPLRFYPDRMQYLHTHLQWIEPMLGERLKAEIRNP